MSENEKSVALLGTMSVSCTIYDTSITLKADEDVLAQVFRLEYEQLVDLWNTHGSGFSFSEISQSPFFSAVALRLLYAKGLGATKNEFVLHDSYANS